MGPTTSPQAGRHCQAGVFTWVPSSVGPAGARTARAARASRTANLSHFISVDRRAACFASLWSDARPVATDKSCRLTLVVRCSWVERSSSWVLGLFARPFCLRSICSRSAAFCCSLRQPPACLLLSPLRDGRGRPVSVPRALGHSCGGRTGAITVPPVPQFNYF